MKKVNLILAAICGVLGIGIIAISSGYPTAADYGTGVPGPGLWPIVISCVLLLCTALMVFKALKVKPEEDTPVVVWSEGTKRVYITMGILLAYVALLEFLGFIIATTVLEFIFIQWFAKKKPIVSLLIALGVTMLIFCVFQFLLNVPVGSFGLIRF